MFSSNSSLISLCHRLRNLLFSALLVATAAPAAATEQVYLSPEAFLAQSFEQAPPAPQLLWLTGERKTQSAAILSHAPPSLRVRYWQAKGKSAWILEEIGKEKPITTGILVEDGKIARLNVLIFRESRGWEVKYPFFSKQFEDAQLDGKQRLNQPIDGISGATLSVRAVTKLARLALLYDSWVTMPE